MRPATIAVVLDATGSSVGCAACMLSVGAGDSTEGSTGTEVGVDKSVGSGNSVASTPVAAGSVAEGSTGAVVSAGVSLTALAPTVLELAGVAVGSLPAVQALANKRVKSNNNVFFMLSNRYGLRQLLAVRFPANVHRNCTKHEEPIAYIFITAIAHRNCQGARILKALRRLW